MSDATTVVPPRTIGAAMRKATGEASAGADDAVVALICVPGRHVYSEAVDAIESGCDVMIISRDVPVEQEIALKELAAQHGRLVMGPDCSTAVVGGIGLGFATAVGPGPVGIVAASGTGAQQALALLDAAGVGVSAVLGVGSRDLSAAVAGRSTMAALDALDADPATELILVVSRPPAEDVAAAVRARADTLGTPVVFAQLGRESPDLTSATEQALLRLGVQVPSWPHSVGRPKPVPSGSLIGLYSGGMLCHEAMLIASIRLGRIGSNVPLRPDWLVDAPAAWDGGHLMIDFTEPELIAGRPHPVRDLSLRADRLASFASDDRVGAVVVDVVLGHGAHADPAAVLAPVITRTRAPVVVALIGAKGDPQDLAAQAATLQESGAHIFSSNAEAVRFACERTARSDP